MECFVLQSVTAAVGSDSLYHIESNHLLAHTLHTSLLRT